MKESNAGSTAGYNANGRCAEAQHPVLRKDTQTHRHRHTDTDTDTDTHARVRSYQAAVLDQEIKAV